MNYKLTFQHKRVFLLSIRLFFFLTVTDGSIITSSPCHATMNATQKKCVAGHVAYYSLGPPSPVAPFLIGSDNFVKCFIEEFK